MIEEFLSPVSTRRPGSAAAGGAEEGRGAIWGDWGRRGREGLVVG